MVIKCLLLIFFKFLQYNFSKWWKEHFLKIWSKFLKNVGVDIFLVKLRFSRFQFAPSIRNPFNSPASTPCISKTTLNFFKLWKFEEDCLKTVGDRFIMKWPLFTFLVCLFRKESIERSSFNPLYLKNYFEFCSAGKSICYLR